MKRYTTASKAWVLLTLEPLEEGQSSPDLEAQALVVDTDNEPTASWTCQTVEADGALTLLAEISLNGQSPEQLSLHVGTDSEQPLAVSFHLDPDPIRPGRLYPGGQRRGGGYPVGR